MNLSRLHAPSTMRKVSYREEGYTFGRERSKIALKEYTVSLLCAFIVVSGALLYIWPNVKALDINYEYTRLDKEKKRLLQHNRLLRIEAESLRSLGMIEKRAMEKGFVNPQSGQIIYVTLRKRAK